MSQKVDSGKIDDRPANHVTTRRGFVTGLGLGRAIWETLDD